jgi:hypothetical protein
MRVKITDKDHIVDKVKDYFHIPKDYFSELLFPSINNITYTYQKPSVNIIGIQHEDDTKLKDGEFVVLFSVENMTPENRTWYKFRNKFGHFGNKRVNAFIYNDIDKHGYLGNAMVIPTIYFRMVHYHNHPERSIASKSFENKKLILFISRNTLNGLKTEFMNLFNNAYPGQCGHIMNHPEIVGKTCYASPELIEAMSNYKFVAVIENSIQDGYITEKIFNTFYAKTIPIYDGPVNSERFINEYSIIRARDPQLLQKVNMLANNEEMYNNVVNSNKLNEQMLYQATSVVNEFCLKLESK